VSSGPAVLALTVVGKPPTDGHSTPPLLKCSAKGMGKRNQKGARVSMVANRGREGGFVPPRRALSR
jgi:hypothetical protein